MMPTKRFLTRSLFAVYKELLLEESTHELEEEVFRLAGDSSVYSDKEIMRNEKRLKEMKAILPYQKLTCHIDGSVLTWYENPQTKEGKKIIGSSAFIVKTESEEVLMKQSFSIPKKYNEKDTNSHIAEYQALVSCLRVLSIYHGKPKHLSLSIFSDSEVVVNQINMAVVTRSEEQRMLRDEALDYMKCFKNVDIQYTPRYYNKEADKMAKTNSLKEKETV